MVNGEMDPLSALSLAGNIVQFVEFACKLVSNTRERYCSSSTTTENLDYIDGIFERLVSFEAQLSRQDNARSQDTATGSVSAHSNALNELLEKCRQECNILLGLTGKIKRIKTTKGRLWESFRKAMLEVWHNDEILKLQSRLHEYQTEIIIRLCAISKENTEQTMQSMQYLLGDISSQRNERLAQFNILEKSLRDLASNVQLIATRICKPNGTGIIRSCTDDEFCLLTDKVSQLALKERSLAREEAMLRSLDYVQRPVRYETIPDAHKRTFSWIFDRGPTSHGFAEWLESGNGIYWITGKPGSGKSTLMKYILHHPKTSQKLSSWSSSTPIVVASHFFWSAGLSIQRSREGLLRSLLYDIFSRAPKLISRIYEDNPESFGQRGRTPLSWSLTWLEDVLRQLTAQKELPIKFCFFIDGLDEFEGDTFDICSTLQNLCSSSDIKMCVASRPWNIFETCLGESAVHRLPVHDLTHDDIRNYVDSELRGHPNWDAQSQTVLRMLREGLMNDDSLTELRMRLDSVPTDLEKFFKHILGSVEPFYHEKQSGTLQVATAADGPLHAHLYSFHDLEYGCDDYAVNHDRRLLNRRDLSQFHIPFARRLNGRCKGLLEIRKQRVEFLHRTVRDFFRTREMTEYLRSKTKDSFNPYLSIFRAHIAWIKSRLSLGDFTSSLSFFSTLSRTLDYAQATEEQNDRCRELCSELLDDLELSVETLILTQGSRIMPRNSEDSDSIETANSFRLVFRHAVIQKQLAHFVSTKLDKDLDYFGDLEKGPLLLALESYSTSRDDYSVLAHPDEESKPSLPKSTKLIQVLLENDWCPNTMFILNPANGLTTPWSEFMSCMVPWHCSRDLSRDLEDDTQECFIHALTSGVFHMLLQHKADPNARISNWQRKNRDDYSLTIGVIWVYLGLKVKDVWKYSELYMRDLKLMINAGADFGDLNLGGTFQGGGTNPALNSRFLTTNWYLPLQTQRLKQELLSMQGAPEQFPNLDLERKALEYKQVAQGYSEEEQMLQNMQESINMSAPSGDVASGKKFQHDLEKWKSLVKAIQEKEDKEKERGPQVMQTRWGLLGELLGTGGVPGQKLFQARLIAELAKADQKKILNWRSLEPIFQSRFPKDIGQIMLKAIHGK
ncbi:hypothetical protein E0Z10_g8258 [Xylaria hypoxylon]|uniref:Uncharacterized protein n=1 Tax=Xylaria hypoxylon TaxID=37992 RepID=A0A4Z0YBS0_9PEZI|nr:hypothetical protein E0Z10_g8258 [Xylaria hypoxylon]